MMLDAVSTVMVWERVKPARLIAILDLALDP